MTSDQFQLLMALLRLLPTRSPAWFSIKKNRWPKIAFCLGHRGFAKSYPENTIESFQKALDAGADGVEFDVCMSRDGIPVVIHDNKVDRTTYSQGLVQDYTAQELRAMAIKGGEKMAQCYIATLAEVMFALPKGTIANVEIKEAGRYSNSDFIESVSKVLNQFQEHIFIVVSSFDPELLYEFKRQNQRYSIGQLFDPANGFWRMGLKNLRKLNPDSLHLMAESINLPIVLLAHLLRIRVVAWTVDNELTAKRLFKMGVDGLISNNAKLKGYIAR